MAKRPSPAPTAPESDATRQSQNPFDAPAETPAPQKPRKWSAQVEDLLRSLRARRETAKSKLSTATSDRDAYKRELRQMRAESNRGRTKEYLERCADLFEALEELDFRRFEIAECSNAMDRVIAEADQMKLIPDTFEIPAKEQWLDDRARTTTEE